MKLVVGLGNPGDKYAGTRHNLGFEALDHILRKYLPLDESTWETSKKANSLIRKLSVDGNDCLLAKPQTFMNNSGISVAALLDYYKIEPEDLIVVHDELDIPLGKVKVKFGGGTAGHNGLESIITHINTDKFIRVRMGIGEYDRNEGSKFDGENRRSTNNYVLGNFSESERKEAKEMIKKFQKNFKPLIENDIETFMSKFNK